MEYIQIFSATKKGKFKRDKVEPLIKYLTKIIKPKCELYEVVGSYRRQKDVVGDIELLVAGFSIEKIIALLGKSKIVSIDEILWKGKVKTALLITSKKFSIKGLQLEVYISNKKCWGASLLTRTGPAALNIMMRSKAKRKGFLKLNEYGLYDKDGNQVAGKTEQSIFKKLNMPYLEPEERNL